MPSPADLSRVQIRIDFSIAFAFAWSLARATADPSRVQIRIDFSIRICICVVLGARDRSAHERSERCYGVITGSCWLLRRASPVRDLGLPCEKQNDYRPRYRVPSSSARFRGRSRLVTQPGRRAHLRERLGLLRFGLPDCQGRGAAGIAAGTKTRRGARSTAVCIINSRPYRSRTKHGVECRCRSTFALFLVCSVQDF